MCLPAGVEHDELLVGSSGVLMSRSGLVLSDGEVGAYFDVGKGDEKAQELVYTDDIEVRIPKRSGRGFKSYKARVLKRDRKVGTSLLEIDVPTPNFRHVFAGRSDGLKVGDFVFAAGNAFGLADEAPPTLTAGVVAAVIPAAEGTAGRFERIYTSAAVTLGVRGGPLVDIHGRLVGTIQDVVSLADARDEAAPGDRAYASFGRVVPIARLRAYYAKVPQATALFAEPEAAATRKTAAALAATFHRAARRAYPAVVSLDIERSRPLSLATPGTRGIVQIPRYVGPVSGVWVGRGTVVTSLYNLANVAGLAEPDRAGELPPDARVQAGISGIERITVHLPDGQAVAGQLCGRHEGLGIAVIRADVPATTRIETLQPVGTASLGAGRFVLALGNPFGAARMDDPLLTVGMLSKQHGPDGPDPWSSQWQTDAGITDANAGGAAVDIRGRLLGITTIWSVGEHGRNSGIGFVVPWDLIQPVLGQLEKGRDYRPPLIGVVMREQGGEVTNVVDRVTPTSPAADAGVQPGDRITQIDDQGVANGDDLQRALRGHWSGDRVQLKLQRGSKPVTVTMTLAARD